MKRYGNLYEKIYDMDNLILAHKHAKKGKGWYKEVKMVDENTSYYLIKLQDMLINKTYKTSEYETFIKNDNGKEREIYKLPYFPDRICQWAIMQIIEPILINNFTKDTYSAIPERGIHLCLDRLNNSIKYDKDGTKYCLKLDAKKYYPSIDHNILKLKYRKIFKDKDLLWLIDEIIDSTSSDVGIPIGNYLSQYSGNFYLSSFDHWIKEVKNVKYYLLLQFKNIQMIFIWKIFVRKDMIILINYGRVKSITKPEYLVVDDYSVWVNSDVVEIEEIVGEEIFIGYEYDMVQYSKDEYIKLISESNETLKQQLIDTQLALVELYESMVV